MRENECFWLFIIFMSLYIIMEIIKNIICPHFPLSPIQPFFLIMYFFFLVCHYQIMTKNMPLVNFLPDEWVSDWITYRRQECLGRSHITCGRTYQECLSTIWLKAMAPHSSTLAWKIPRTEEPGRLQSMLRVGHDWATSLSLFTFLHWRRKWQPTPVFLPGESQGRGSWWAAVYGVAQSRARLKWLSSSSSWRLAYSSYLKF